MKIPEMNYMIVLMVSKSYHQSFLERPLLNVYLERTLGLVMIQVKAIIILVDACSFYLTSIDDVFVNFRKFYVKETVRRI